MTVSPRLRALLSSLLLAALVFAIYAQTAQHQFVAFDTNFVTDNPHVTAGITSEGLRWALTASYSANWLPLTWWSHMLDFELFGLDPGAHNLVNVGLHALASIALFLALARMTRAIGRSWFVAALFAVHPLHVESVAWIIERKDVLSALFGWSCVYAYAVYAERPSAGRYLLVCVCLALGLASKSMLVTWPAVLLLFDLWPLAREGLGWRRLLSEKLLLCALSAGAALATWLSQSSGGAVQALGSLPLSQRLANAPVAAFAYLRKTFWPSDLAFFYPHPRDTLSGGEIVLACAVLLAVGVAAALVWKRARYVAVGWCFFVGTLVPVIGIVQVGGQAYADRYTYIPLTGVFVALTWGVCDLWPRATRVRAALAGAVVAVLAFVAHAQTATWRDTETMCARALAVTEHNHMAHIVLGNARIERGELDAGIEELRAALRESPREAEALGNLAVALYRKGQHADAEISAREAIAIAPSNAGLHNQLAATLIGQRRYEEARRAAEESLRLDPTNPSALSNLGVALEELGRMQEARTAYERALRARPDFNAARLSLARLALRAGDLARAEAVLREALAIEPANARAARELARALTSQAKSTEAHAVLERALELRPGSSGVASDLVWLLASDAAVRDPRRAIDVGERALTSGEASPALLDALALAYAASGDFSRARETAVVAGTKASDGGDRTLAAKIAKRAEAYAAGRIDLTIPR